MKKRIAKLSAVWLLCLAMIASLGMTSFANPVDAGDQISAEEVLDAGTPEGAETELPVAGVQEAETVDVQDEAAEAQENEAPAADAQETEASEIEIQEVDPAEVPEEDLPPTIQLEEVENIESDAFNFTDEDIQLELLEEAESFESKFSLVDEGYITPVKLQNPFGSCWAFAAAAAAESSIISDGLADKTLDLSERHLSIFTCTPIKDENHPQYGEGFIDEGVSASDKLNRGGYSLLATSVFANGMGPVEEKTDPDNFAYKGRNGYVDMRYFDGGYRAFSYSADDDWSIPSEKQFAKDYALKESYILPASGDYEIDTQEFKASIAAVKKQLKQNRAVEIGFLADQSSPNQDDVAPMFLSPKWAHYGDFSKVANHAVTIVGWDDDLSVDMFLENKQPPGPGAWLVKNSWGSGEVEFPNKGSGDWGIKVPKKDADGNVVTDESGNPVMVGSGYFWLSYYDRSISNPESLKFEKADSETIMDAHDYMPAMDMYATEFDQETKMANLFIASQNQELTQISFQTTHPNTTVSYEVYIMSDDNIDPYKGLKVAEGEPVLYEFGGFHKVDLETPVKLFKHQNYAIIVTEKTSDGKWTVAVPISQKSSYNAVVKSEESLVYMDETWDDLVVSSVREKLGGKDEIGIQSVDNFPIKGYAKPIEGVNFSMDLLGTGNLFHTSSRGLSVLKLRVTDYLKDGAPTFPTDAKVTWTVDPENLVDIDASNSYEARLRVRKEDGKCVVGKGTLYVTLEGYGTLSLPIVVETQSMDGVAVEERDEEGHIRTTFVYTGSPLTPRTEAQDFVGSPMVQDVDYTVEYSNNTNCGVATIKATTIGDYVPNTQETYFAILPPAVEITKVTAGPESVTVSVKDLKKIGVSGYEVDYREAGTTKWKTEKFTADSPNLVVKGLTKGKKYDVRVRGYLKIDDYKRYYIFYEDTFYGDYSEVSTSDAVKDGILPTAVKLNKTSAEMATSHEKKNDSTLQLKVTFTPANTSNTAMTWKSSNEKVATVDQNGVVTALTYGTATITGTSKANKKLKVTCKIQTRFYDATKDNVTSAKFDAIYWAADKKITGNTVSFGTNNSMTRGQFVRFLYRYAGSPAVKTSKNPFKDVDSKYTHYKAILWAVENGLIGGYSDGTFKPEKSLTRSNVATILWKMAGSPKVANAKNPFSDVAKSAAIAWGKSKKIFTGSKFKPNDNCLRGDFALFLYNYDKNVK